MSDLPLFEPPQGSFPLRLPHDSRRAPLQAWDAADHYLLRELDSHLKACQEGRDVVELWIIEDHYGSLSVPLLMSVPHLRLTVISDPLCAREWISDNLERCLASVGRQDELGALKERLTVTSLPEVERSLDAERGAGPSGALVKIGPQLSLTRGALRLLAQRPSLEWVIGGGMCKHIHTSTVQAFEAHLGESPTSLAWKKARLIRPTLTEARPPARLSSLSSYTLDVEQSAPFGERARLLLSSLSVLNLEGTFSEGQLDQGARAFIPHLGHALKHASLRRAEAGRPVSTEDPLEVADLGCGDGVLTWSLIACAADQGVALRVTCLDLSSAAMSSAQRTWDAWREAVQLEHDSPIDAEVIFCGGDALAPWRQARALDQGELDLILNNPPFHQRGATVSSISERMFREAADALSAHGALWVVGNRHLRYHQHLKRTFQRVRVESDHPKFVVLCATGPLQTQQDTRSRAPLNAHKGPRRRNHKPATQLKQGRLRERRR